MEKYIKKQIEIAIKLAPPQGEDGGNKIIDKDVFEFARAVKHIRGFKMLTETEKMQVVRRWWRQYKTRLEGRFSSFDEVWQGFLAALPKIKHPGVRVIFEFAKKETPPPESKQFRDKRMKILNTLFWLLSLLDKNNDGVFFISGKLLGQLFGKSHSWGLARLQGFVALGILEVVKKENNKATRYKYIGQGKSKTSEDETFYFNPMSSPEKLVKNRLAELQEKKKSFYCSSSEPENRGQKVNHIPTGFDGVISYAKKNLKEHRECEGLQHDSALLLSTCFEFEKKAENGVFPLSSKIAGQIIGKDSHAGRDCIENLISAGRVERITKGEEGQASTYRIVHDR